MKIAIVGSRDFNNYFLLKTEIDKLNLDIDLIISGGAKGADSLGERYAKERKIKTKIFYPDWNKFGSKAGPLRNTQIIENSDVVIAFWNGISTGTLDSINKAKRMKKLLFVIDI